MFLLFFFCILTRTLTAADTDEDTAAAEDYGLTGELTRCVLEHYEATCSLQILQENIQATVLVNHCHMPLDITFSIVYRYGKGSSHHWQYTFVTTNQNERILIPGLTLANAPHALVFLYVRVPQPLFQLHNASLAAVEASLYAQLSHDEWEEVEFINDSVVVGDKDKCPGGKLSTPHHLNNTMFLYIGIVSLLLLVATAATVGGFIFYRRRKRMNDQLVLVHSLETGLPGAEPYQLGPNQSQTPISNGAPPTKSEATPTNESKLNLRGLISGFKFGRLKEETGNESGSQSGNNIEALRQKAKKKMEKAVVIGNPVLVDKTSMFKEDNADKSVERGANPENNNESGTIQNMNAEEDGNEDGVHGKEWKMHPLESESEGSTRTKSNAKSDIPKENIELESKER